MQRSRERTGLLVGALGLCMAISTSYAQLPVTSGLTLHLRADTGVQTVNGNEVISWQDLSGNGWHMTNYAAAQRPSLVSSVVNGQPVIRFDGTDDFVDNQNTTLASFITASEFTIVTVFETSAMSQGAGAVFTQDMVLGDTAGYVGVVVESNLTTSAKTLSMYNWDGDADVATIAGYDTGSFRVFSGWHGGGTVFASTFVGNNSSAPSGNTQFLGGFMRIGSGYSAGTTYFNGDIAEIAIYNRALSDAERNLVANRLADNYALSVPEPASAALLGLGGLFLWKRRR